MTAVEPKIFIHQSKNSDFEQLVKAHIDPLLAEILARRGITEPEKARRFLNPSLSDMHDPAAIGSIERVVKILEDAKRRGEKVCVFGDYDCDGITSAAILCLALKDLGLDVSVRLPDRFSEGYGMTAKAVREIVQQGYRLIVTVDNGITQFAAVQAAKDLGVRVIVLDHHAPGDVLPAADVVVDLHLPGERYPYKELAGCGLAYKVAAYLYERLGRAGEETKLLDLAAIGTVADVVPLIDENRIIVSEGLGRMSSKDYARVGILELARAFALDLANIRASDIAFKLAPALNAAGRLVERGAELSLRLLLSESATEAAVLAKQLYDINEERKRITETGVEAAEKYISERKIQDDHVLVLFLPDVPEGVVGLVSGKITERYNRPSIVITESSECFKGSARSIDAFNLTALKTCADLFLGWGGHALAAGLSMKKDLAQIELLRERINEYAATVLEDDDLIPTIWVDRILDEKEIVPELVDLLDKLEPYGAGNPRPVFWVKRYTTRLKYGENGWQHFAFVGTNGQHLRVFGYESEAMGFDMAKSFEGMNRPRELEILCTIQPYFFMGNRYTRLEILNMKPAEEKPQVRTQLMDELENALAQLTVN